MRKKRFVTTWAVVEVIFLAVLAGGFYLSRNKADLIIYYGVRTANALVIAVIAIALAALIISFFLFLGAYQKRYRRLRPQKPAPAPAPAQAKPDVNSEEYIRGKIEYFLGVRPRLRGELTECLNQMDSINEKQASLREVRTRIDAGFLQNVAESLDKAESSIWKNLLAIINVAEIWDPKEAGDPAWAAVYDEPRASIRSGLKLNDDLLKQCAILLTKGTAFANDKSLSREAENDLDATITVIDRLRDMGGFPGSDT